MKSIIVHCTKPMLVVHHHPHLMQVPGQSEKLKQHLASPHDHHLRVTATMRCEHLERDKDLLLLHTALEHATEYPKRVDMGHASFEQIAVIIQARVTNFAIGTGNDARIRSIKIDAHDEGAEVIWEGE